MRIRQFIAALMVLLSLTAQARAAFACAMMPAAVQAHGCCPDQGSDRCVPPGTGACCDARVPGDAPLAAVSAFKPYFLHADHPALAWGPAPHLLPAAFDTGDRRARPPASSSPPQAPLPLYLLTARLRL
jgi:hypothetical protein